MMNRETLKTLLDAVSAHQVSVTDALDQLKRMPFDDVGFARVDLHRALRSGFPEVIYGEGKTNEQVMIIAEKIIENGGPLLATRITEECAKVLIARFPDGVFHSLPRVFTWYKQPPADQGRGPILVVAAGTSDLPVAEEAALTAWMMGNRVERLFDVGVAGIHRLLASKEQIQNAQVLVVVAGMEGALPSVVAGFVGRPVIAVPTSVGYGASFHGLSALLTMLNSCVPGVTVVNIDNGFGAGYTAALINRNESKG
jgi:pyridinium-3,5-biscarboxylic acid mononucleotide synthase